MSNLDPEKNYENLSDTLRFVWEQLMKDVNTCLPGIVESYDPETKRADVRPAIRTRLTNNEVIEKPLIVNCPVMWSGGGGWVAHFPLRENDKVLLVFAQRGITEFKKTYKSSNPDKESFFDLTDAVAFPVFGALRITPSKSDALTIQKETGNPFVSLKDNEVEANLNGNFFRLDENSLHHKFGSTEVELGSADLTLRASGALNILTSTVNHQGTNIGNTHAHSYTTPQHAAGSASTGGPS